MVDGKSPPALGEGEGEAGKDGNGGDDCPLLTLIGARTGSCKVNAAGPSACAPSVAARTPTDCST